MDDQTATGALPPAADRARWLAELALAIDQAEVAATRLGLTHPHSAEALELRSRLEAVRHEIEAIRLGGWRAPIQELGSKWINLGTG